MSTVSVICDRLGRQAMASRLGVKKGAISNAVADGRFPARWFKIVSAMCSEVEQDCPLDAFAWADPAPADSERTA